MKTIRTLVILGALVLAGCATTTIKLAPSLASSAPRRHMLTIERDSSIQLMGHMPIAVWVDGKPSVTVKSGLAVTMYLPDGRHLIGVSPAGARMPKTPTREIAVDISADHQPILFTGFIANGWGGIALREVKHPQ